MSSMETQPRTYRFRRRDRLDDELTERVGFWVFWVFGVF